MYNEIMNCKVWEGITIGSLILIVDDEKAILDILQYNLERQGYETMTAVDGEEAVEKALKYNPDLLLLDVMLPKMDGYDVCRAIRQKSEIPIIMLTARDGEVDKVLGLELGADDYMTKPFSERELLARIKANLRRRKPSDTQLADETHTSDEHVLKIGTIEIDPMRYEVKKNGEYVELTLREFELLKFLADSPGRIFSREMLLEKVWGYEYYGDVRTVDVTVSRLREKIEDDPSKHEIIMTKRGVGYYFAQK
jgi:Response regulators consisting of a CheY-like receiver domain and a winged-helix DNA-binding domain